MRKETFLGDLKTHPEVTAKRLTELEKEETNKLITREEIYAGKTPGE